MWVDPTSVTWGFPRRFSLVAGSVGRPSAEVVGSRNFWTDRAEGDGARTLFDLRKAVGIRDIGHVNYHLDRLRGTFVRRTEDGYLLTEAGEAIGDLLAHQAVEDSSASVSCLPLRSATRRLSVATSY